MIDEDLDGIYDILVNNIQEIFIWAMRDNDIQMSQDSQTIIEQAIHHFVYNELVRFEKVVTYEAKPVRSE